MTWTGRECASPTCPGLPPLSLPLGNQPEPTSLPWSPIPWGCGGVGVR